MMHTVFFSASSQFSLPRAVPSYIPFPCWWLFGCLFFCPFELAALFHLGLVLETTRGRYFTSPPCFYFVSFFWGGLVSSACHQEVVVLSSGLLPWDGRSFLRGMNASHFTCSTSDPCRLKNVFHLSRHKIAKIFLFNGYNHAQNNPFITNILHSLTKVSFSRPAMSHSSIL